MIGLVAGLIFAFSWVTLTVVHHNHKEDPQAACDRANEEAYKKAVEAKADYFNLPKECKQLDEYK